MSILAALPSILIPVIPIARPAMIFDEWTYSVQSRLDPDSIETHGFLYSHLVNGAMSCGLENYFDCGRILSLPFLSLQLVMVFIFARLFLGRAVAALIATATLAFTSTIWTYLFTPESIHISLSIVAFMCLSIGFILGRGYFVRLVLASSVVFALASLVKVHTVLVLPALFIIVILLARRSGLGFQNSFLLGGGFLGLFFSVRFLIGFLLVGPKGISLLGGYQETILSFVSGELTSPSERGAGGVYFGLGDTPFTSLGYDVADLPFLFLFQLWTTLPIVILAFAGVFVAVTLRPDYPEAQENVAGEKLRVILSSSLILLVNLVLLSTSFGALVTVIGDDHTGRPLFRYVEYGLVISLVISAIYMVSSNGFSNSSGRKIRYIIFAIIPLSLLFGGQGTITPGYADSSFIPVIGRPEFWIPLAILAIILGLTLPYVSKSIVRNSIVLTWLALYIAAGIVANLEYVSGASSQNNVGSETGAYLLEGRDPRGLETLFLGRGTLSFGTAMTEAQFDKKNYRIVLGSTPADLDDVPDEYDLVVALEEIIVVADSTGWRLLETTNEAEIFIRGSTYGKTFKDLATSSIEPDITFDFYGGGAFFSESGEIILRFENELTQGDQVAICFDTVREMVNPEISIIHGQQTVNVNIPSGRTCLDFAIASSENTDTLKIVSTPISFELNDGQTVGEIGVGVSSVDLY